MKENEKANFKVYLLPGCTNLDRGIRFSAWEEKMSEYCVPCEFQEVNDEGGYYLVKAILFDSDDKINSQLIGSKFFFGHPLKIMCFGYLIGIE